MLKPDVVAIHVRHRDRVRKMEVGATRYLHDVASGLTEAEAWTYQDSGPAGTASLRIVSDTVIFSFIGAYPSSFDVPERYWPAREVVVPLYYGSPRVGEFTFTTDGSATYTGTVPSSSANSNGSWTYRNAETGQAPA